MSATHPAATQASTATKYSRVGSKSTPTIRAPPLASDGGSGSNGMVCAALCRRGAIITAAAAPIRCSSSMAPLPCLSGCENIGPPLAPVRQALCPLAPAPPRLRPQYRLPVGFAGGVAVTGCWPQVRSCEAASNSGSSSSSAAVETCSNRANLSHAGGEHPKSGIETNVGFRVLHTSSSRSAAESDLPVCASTTTRASPCCCSCATIRAHSSLIWRRGFKI